MTPEYFSVRIWDLPTRVFHWALAAAVVACVVSAHVGGNALVWHFRLGYVVFALLVFRLVWGLVGGRWSRFSSFVRAPATTVRYLRGQTRPDEHLDVGHNPLGAWSVLGLIALLAVQVGTGLFADDEIANTGPLIKFVSSATSSLLTHWHTDFGQWLVVGLAVLHVAAILFYRIKKNHDLVRPMLTGDKLLPSSVPASIDTRRTRTLAALLILLSAGLVTWVVSLGA